MSRPVKLKSVKKKKNGKIFQWLPVFMVPPDRNTSSFLYTDLPMHDLSISFIWFDSEHVAATRHFEFRDIVKQECYHG